MLDEVPMLWSGLTMLYIILELEHVAPNTKYGSWLPIACTTHAVVCTLLVALTDGNLQFCLFHLSFGSCEFYALYRIKCIAELEEMKQFSKLGKWALGIYFLGIFCW
jgi:dihydroceramidase